MSTTVKEMQRRFEERDPYICIAYITLEQGEEHHEGIARTVDLSPHGIGLMVTRELPIHAKICIELLIPGNLWLLGRGIICHQSLTSEGFFRIGVKFTSPPTLVERFVSVQGKEEAHGLPERQRAHA